MTVANIPDDLANSPTPPGTAGPSSHLQSSTKAEGESFVFPGVAQSRRSTMGPHFFQQPEEDDWTIRFATAFASAMKANADQNMKDLSELINRDREPRPPQIKATPPEKFNGLDPNLLPGWIAKLDLYQQVARHTTALDKINAALLLLEGPAFDFFAPFLEVEEAKKEDFVKTSYSAFLTKLRENFGPIDAVANAEDEICNLVMNTNDHIVDYNIKFRRLPNPLQSVD